MGGPSFDSREFMSPRPAISPMRMLIGGIVFFALVAAVSFSWWHERIPVREIEVEQFLDRTQGAGHLRFSVAHLVTLHGNGAKAQVAVAATAQTLVPLYLKVDTADYLRRLFHADYASILDAHRLLGVDGVSRSTIVPATGPLPADPYEATVLQLMSPAGATFEFQGIIDVQRTGGNVSLTLASGGFAGAGPQGDARSNYPGTTYSAGDPQDDANLGKLVADLEKFSRSVAKSPGAPESGKAASNEGRREMSLAEISPGRVYRGVATRAGQEMGTTLYLEILDVSPQNEVRALLRNEGGWISARPFQGKCSADDSPDGPTLSLTSLPNQAIRGSGPFLEEAQTWSFMLHSDATSGLSGESRLYRLRFESLSTQQASEAIDRLSREYRDAVQAARAGSLYIGTATARDSGRSDPVLLRFAAQTDGGVGLDARLEATSKSWKRRLHGMIVTNARRSGGKPIRLLADLDGAVGDAPEESFFGFRDDLELHLGVDSGRLYGEDARFTYRLAAATAADLARLEGDQTERTARMLGVFRPGIAYDGILREEQGFTSRARLEIDSIDRQSGSLSARIVSLSRSRVYREFHGSLDPSGSVVLLNAKVRNAPPPDDEFDAPFLKTAAAVTLHISVAGNTIMGRIEGDSAWVMEFPVGAFIATQASVEKPNPAALEEAAYPPFPKEGDAYLLTAGAWSPLPKNQGHVVIETVRPDSGLHLTLNLLDALNEGVGLVTREKDKQKIPYFQFEGKDPRPVARGPVITVLFVGSTPSARPPVELVPGELLKDGRRRILIMRPTAGTIRFMETRLAAYVRQVAPGCVLLTTTSSPEPGPYVFNADTAYELTIE